MNKTQPMNPTEIITPLGDVWQKYPYNFVPVEDLDKIIVKLENGILLILVSRTKHQSGDKFHVVEQPVLTTELSYYNKNADNV